MALLKTDRFASPLLSVGEAEEEFGHVVVTEPRSRRERQTQVVQAATRLLERDQLPPGKPCEFGHVNAITAIGLTGNDLSQKHDIPIAFLDGHAVVLDSTALRL